ncbi:hypothetical protein QAD02_012063 [Eretmocerus hayati]|uniref:Uncharacterized protein n=1 Tax=Eretmocerus hayati TaxID=131215 RepID=A0ACC2NYS1_9HYME|nr:hypothetical protein QAD02_012063 [Eretmocerus hayati]
MSQVPQVIREWGYDPAALPNATRNIGGFYFTLSTDVDIDMWNGTLTGLSNLKLMGPANVQAGLPTILTGTFLFPELNSTYESLTLTLFDNVYGIVNTTLRDVEIEVSLSYDLLFTNSVTDIKTKLIKYREAQMSIQDDSSSYARSWLIETVRAEVLEHMPGIIDEASTHLMKSALGKINKSLPKILPQIIADIASAASS